MENRILSKCKSKVKEAVAKLNAKLKSNGLIVTGIKYIPFLCTLLLTVHVGLLVFGVREPVTVSLAGILMSLLLILLSEKFGFCKLHKTMIIYMCITAICICANKLANLGWFLAVLHVVMFSAGVALIALSVKKYRDNECDK